MLRQYDKCRFCKWYDCFDGCTNWFCNNKDGYEVCIDRVISKAKEEGISVADVVALMKLEE